MPAPTVARKTPDYVIGRGETASRPSPAPRRRQLKRGQGQEAAEVQARARRTAAEEEKRRRDFLKNVGQESRAKTQTAFTGIQSAIAANQGAQAALLQAQTLTAIGDAAADARASQYGGSLNVGAVGGNKIVQLAKTQIGAPYVWAEANPKGGRGGPGSGFDCSGLTQWVVKRATGRTLPHMASQQQSLLPRIGRDQLRVGDLVFFNYGRKAAGVADHVGIYIGNGLMVHASSSSDRVRIAPVDWSHFLHGGAIRAR